MKKLAVPPMNPVRWVGELRDGRKVIIVEKLWYGAQEALCRQFGVARDQVLDVRLATPSDDGEPVQPRKVITLDFDLSPDFTIFEGPALDPEIGGNWDLFETTANDAVRDEAARRGICVAYGETGLLLQPQYEDDAEDASEHEDFDAALAYLNTGGRLVKLPDEPGSKYYRLYPVVHLRKSQ